MTGLVVAGAALAVACAAAVAARQARTGAPTRAVLYSVAAVGLPTAVAAVGVPVGAGPGVTGGGTDVVYLGCSDPTYVTDLLAALGPDRMTVLIGPDAARTELAARFPAARFDTPRPAPADGLTVGAAVADLPARLDDLRDGGRVILFAPRTDRPAADRAALTRLVAARPWLADRVFWAVDNGSSHRGQKAIDRLAGQFPNAVMVHTPVHTSGSTKSRSTSR